LHVSALTFFRCMNPEKHPAVYILASRYRGTLYVGVTSSLWQRVWDHMNGRLEGFTKDYGVKTLVWYEHYLSMEEAIRREKQIKKWNRAWKIELIEKMNPDWIDLHDIIDVTATLVTGEAGPPLSRG
jgi:putative endonuclease